MKLNEYLTEHSMTQAQFAARCGVHKSTISRILSGRADASRVLASRIVAETGGRVRFEDLWCSDRPAQRAARRALDARASREARA